MIKITENFRWIIGILIAILLGVLTIYISKYQSKKSLAYQEISFYTTNYKANNLEEGLRIIYNEKEVENLHTLVLEFINNGNTPIRTNDFESDLLILFSDKTKILRADIIKSIPESIPIQLEYSDSLINVKPTLLNADDRFMVQIILTGYPDFPKINGRIAGVVKVSKIINSQVEYRRTPLTIWLDGIGGFLLLILAAAVVSFVFLKSELNPFFGKLEIMLWVLILYNGGSGLIGYWGENIDFMLPKWLTLVLQLLIFPLLIWLFYKLRLVKLKKN